MPSRSVTDFLVWIPALVYGVSFGIAMVSSNRPSLGDVVPTLMFAVLALAHTAQSNRVRRLESRLASVTR